MSVRNEFGFARTSCVCRRCSICCEHVPGALAPGDLEPMAQHLGYGDDVAAFARDNLLASEGVDVITDRDQIVHLRTLVPATQANGHCKFLQAGRCAVHAVSPFGCAFIDAHQSDDEFAVRSDALYRALYEDMIEAGPYRKTWEELQRQGKCPEPLEVRGTRLHAAMRDERLV